MRKTRKLTNEEQCKRIARQIRLGYYNKIRFQ